MRAYNKYLIVDKIDEPVVLKSGLQLSASDMDEMRYQRAKVTAPVGNLIVGINEGDEIYYDKSRGFDVKFDGRVCTVVSEDFVVAVL